MRLLDRIMTKKEINSELDMLKGNIARVAVTNDPTELVEQLGFAVDRLNMIAYSRMMEMQQKLAEAQKNF